MSCSISLMFFASKVDENGPYDLLLDCARFADNAGFEAVWLPERHFTSFGGQFSAPAVLCGALALITQRVGLRAGSVVVPLQDPVRVVEQWSIVDNLSRGRVAISCAAGWHPDDFCLAPEHFATRRHELIKGVTQIEALWRGKAMSMSNGVGCRVEVVTLPRPVQPELPLWITAVGRHTFELAGALGANVLTGAVGMTLSELGNRIETYRNARRRSARGGRGLVTLMQHTYLADRVDLASEMSLPHLKGYLAAFLDQSIPEMIKGSEMGAILGPMSAADRESCLGRIADIFMRDRSLIGDLKTCAAQLERLAGIGVDEVACLVDFGPPRDKVIQSLSRLAQLIRR